MSAQTRLILLTLCCAVLAAAVLVNMVKPKNQIQAAPIAIYGVDNISDPRPTLRVLMIGNSHLRRGAIAGKVAALANQNIDTCPHYLITGFYGVDGAMLIDHWHRTGAKQAVMAEPWDHVLLQDASWSTIFPAAAFDQTVSDWVRLATEQGAKAVLITTWARDNDNAMYAAVPVFESDRDLMQGVVTRRYAATAKRLGVETIPVGPAWQLAWTSRDLPTLFHSDGNHTNSLSQWLTALTIYHHLCDQPEAMPEGLLPTDIARYQGTLWQAVQGARGRKYRQPVKN